MYPTNDSLLNSLKGLFEGETVVILGCSPYIGSIDRPALENVCRNNKVISLKQSYLLFPDLVDIHIYNCCNIQRYEYGDSRPIVIESSSAPPSINNFDLFFMVKERDKRKSVSWVCNQQENFSEIDKWSITNSSNPYLRPYGPGIMTEIVFYLCEYLGASKIVLIGCDNKSMGNVTHFYRDKNNYSDHTFNDPHAGSPWVDFNEEKSLFLNSMVYWQQWLSSKNITIENASKFHYYPKTINHIGVNEIH